MEEKDEPLCPQKWNLYSFWAEVEYENRKSGLKPHRGLSVLSLCALPTQYFTNSLILVLECLFWNCHTRETRHGKLCALNTMVRPWTLSESEMGKEKKVKKSCLRVSYTLLCVCTRTLFFLAGVRYLRIEQAKSTWTFPYRIQKIN